MKKITYCVVAVLAYCTLGMGSCDPYRQSAQQIADAIAQSSPAAKTPVLQKVIDGMQLQPDQYGFYEIKHTDVGLFFSTPFIGSLKIDIDGVLLTEGHDAGNGYYTTTVLNADPVKDQRADWSVILYPPATKLNAQNGFTINIVYVSLNPKFQGTDKESAPLSISILPVPPAPYGTSLKTLGINQIQFYWMYYGYNQDSFKVERSVNGGPYQQIQVEALSGPAPQGSNYIDTVSTYDAAYTYRASAVNKNGSSAYSQPVSITPKKTGSLEILLLHKNNDPMNKWSTLTSSPMLAPGSKAVITRVKNSTTNDSFSYLAHEDSAGARSGYSENIMFGPGDVNALNPPKGFNGLLVGGTWTAGGPLYDPIHKTFISIRVDWEEKAK